MGRLSIKVKECFWSRHFTENTRKAVLLVLWIYETSFIKQVVLAFLFLFYFILHFKYIFQRTLHHFSILYLNIIYLLLLFSKICYILSTNKHSKLFSIFINQQHLKFSFA